MSVTDVTGRFPIPLKWPRLPMDMNKVEAIVIHHTAVDPWASDPDAGLVLPAAQMTVEDELNHIAVIHLYHKSKGYGGFGYHLIVFPSGRAYLVTSLWQWGSHVAGRNDRLWGIAFAGDFTGRLPGPAQIEGGRECVSLCTESGELPIKPHSAYGGTTCPGRLVEILDQLVSQPEEEDDMLKLKTIAAKGRPGQWVTDGLSKRQLPGETPWKEQLIKLGLLDPEIRWVPVEFFDWLPVGWPRGCLADRLKLTVG